MQEAPLRDYFGSSDMFSWEKGSSKWNYYFLVAGHAVQNKERIEETHAHLEYRETQDTSWSLSKAGPNRDLNV
jgi:hypothetical protein